MAEELDALTAAEVGHALVRWLIDEDPGGVGNFLPDFAAQSVDDAKAARIGSTVVELLQRIDVA